MTEVLNHEIEQLKEENDKLKCNCFISFKDPETCETIINGVKFSNEQIIVLSSYINNYQAIRQDAVEEFSRKVFSIIDELYGVEGSRRFQEIRGQYLKDKINDLLKEL